MKLELKHIAPYLPYGLNFQCLDVESGEWEIVGLSKIDLVNETLEIGNIDVDISEMKDSNIKLILRPLSEFSKEKTGREVMDILNCEIDAVWELWQFSDGTKKLEQLSVKTYNVMCENCVDFNNLIPNGLAIDINTLEN